jgi:hypothetical protein
VTLLQTGAPLSDSSEITFAALILNSYRVDWNAAPPQTVSVSNP